MVHYIIIALLTLSIESTATNTTDLCDTANPTRRSLLKMLFAPDVTYRLFWTPPTDNGSPVLRYKIAYWPTASTTTSERVEVLAPPEDTSRVLSHLLPETHYTLHLSAENQHGTSSPSVYTIYTGSNLIPTYPLSRICNITVQDLTATTVTFGFVLCDPLIEVTTFEGRFINQANASQTINKTWSAQPPYTLTGLDPGATYTFKIRVRNRHGEGAVHTGIRLIRMPEAGPPRAPQLLPVTRNYYRLRWKPRANVTVAEYGVDYAGGSGTGSGGYVGVREYWDWNGVQPNATYNLVVSAKKVNRTGSACRVLQNLTITTQYHAEVEQP